MSVKFKFENIIFSDTFQKMIYYLCWSILIGTEHNINFFINFSFVSWGFDHFSKSLKKVFRPLKKTFFMWVFPKRARKKMLRVFWNKRIEKIFCEIFAVKLGHFSKYFLKIWKLFLQTQSFFLSKSSISGFSFFKNIHIIISRVYYPLNY